MTRLIASGLALAFLACSSAVLGAPIKALQKDMNTRTSTQIDLQPGDDPRLGLGGPLSPPVIGIGYGEEYGQGDHGKVGFGEMKARSVTAEDWYHNSLDPPPYADQRHKGVVDLIAGMHRVSPRLFRRTNNFDGSDEHFHHHYAGEHLHARSDLDEEADNQELSEQMKRPWHPHHHHHHHNMHWGHPGHMGPFEEEEEEEEEEEAALMAMLHNSGSFDAHLMSRGDSQLEGQTSPDGFEPHWHHSQWDHHTWDHPWHTLLPHPHPHPHPHPSPPPHPHPCTDPHRCPPGPNRQAWAPLSSSKSDSEEETTSDHKTVKEQNARMSFDFPHGPGFIPPQVEG